MGPGGRITMAGLLLCCLPGLALGQDFDFLMLVRQWGPGACAGMSCKYAPVEAYSLHGFWPQYKNGGSPKDCDPKNKLDTSAFPKALLNQMACEWPSYTGSNAGFWQYEWATHGTCALPLFKTQQAYFNATIVLNNLYDPNVVLASVAKPGSRATKSALQSALKSAWGCNSVISCNNNDDLFEVWTCFSKALQPIDCPSSVGGRKCDSSLDVLTGDPVPASCAPYYSTTVAAAPSSARGPAASAPSPVGIGGQSAPMAADEQLLFGAEEAKSNNSATNGAVKAGGRLAAAAAAAAAVALLL